MNSNLFSEINNIKDRILDDQLNKKVKIAFFGQPGAGKSSLINKIIGTPKMSVGLETDVTKLAQIVEYNEAIYIDLPGYGTSKFPANEYFQTFDPLQYDLFVCVFSGKFHQADSHFFRELEGTSKPCIFVRNFSDNIYDDESSEDEIKNVITADVRKQVGAKIKVFFTSCHSSMSDVENGIKDLMWEIENKLDLALRESFVLSSKAYTLSNLERKKALCEQRISLSAKAAALNALNPLPGVDVALDLAVVFKLFEYIRNVFGFTQDVIEKSHIPLNLANNILKGLTKEGIVTVLKNYATKIGVKETSKWIPVVGQAVAAMVGFGIVKYAGDDYMKDCYNAAAEIMECELANEKQP